MIKVNITNWSDESLIQYLNEQLALGFFPVLLYKHMLYLEQKSIVPDGQFFIDYSSSQTKNYRQKKSPYINSYLEQGFQLVTRFKQKYLFYTADSTAIFPTYPDSQKWKDHEKSTKRILSSFTISFILLVLLSLIQSEGFFLDWISLGFLPVLIISSIVILLELGIVFKYYLKAKKSKQNDINFNDFATTCLLKQPSVVTAFYLSYPLIATPCLLIQTYYTGLSSLIVTFLLMDFFMIAILYANYVVTYGKLKPLKQKRTYVCLISCLLFIAFLHYLPKPSSHLELSDTLPIITYPDLYANRPTGPLHLFANQPGPLQKESVTQKNVPFAEQVFRYYAETKSSAYVFYSYKMNNHFIIPLYYDHYQKSAEEITELSAYYPTYGDLTEVYLYEKLPYRYILMATYNSTFIYVQLTSPSRFDADSFLDTISNQISTIYSNGN